MTSKISTRSRKKQNIKDPVEVYCRVRPLKEDEDESCAVVKPPNILQIIPSSGSHAYKNGERIGTQHTFRTVFDGKTTQKQMFDEIALPLVEDVIQGKNGLLFAYGITNSGKTYTMSGEPDQPGILPRIMDVLFNTIADVQTPKCVFRPDHFNGFNVFTEAEALTESNRQKPRKISPRARSEMPEFGNIVRVAGRRTVPGVDEDNSYSVFISYVEIYNNFVYDLLEEPTESVLHPKPPSSKNMREDSKHNMYISGVTEREVRNTEEAYDVLLQGQRKRRVAETQLNHDSSRSHAVFNIRVVQAPLDLTGAEVLQDTSKIVVSQLSLVDLAGSERVSRTCNEGERLREAGNINQSLMVLRNCMEILRENHINGTSKHVPYRDSKLTHFFKNHFDGDGKVRMIVCISPKADNYDETIHVMKFAEVTQEVVVERSLAPNRIDVGLAPGRRRANLAYRSALDEVNSLTKTKEIIHPYKVALGIICLQKYLGEDCSVTSLSEFKSFLKNRHQMRQQLIEDLHQKQADFRSKLVSTEQELATLRAKIKEYQTQHVRHEKSQRETARLKGVINNQQQQITQLTVHVNKDQKEIDELKKIVKEYETVNAGREKSEKEARRLKDIINTQRQQVDQLASQLDSYQTHATEQIKGRVAKEREKFECLAHEMEVKEQEYYVKDEKLRQVRELIKNSPLAAARSNSNVNSPFKEKKGQKDNKTKPGNPPLYNKVGGRKRSLSENWLEHNPPDTVNNGDLLQPRYKKKKTITNPKPKHFNSKKVDKYVLKHQEQDSEGDVQTELYKGEILLTRSGGASVKFTDIEKLKHSSPERQKRWTRSMSRRVISNNSSMSSSTDISIDGEWTDVETRCAVGIEGKPGSSPAYSHIAVDKREKAQ